MSNTNIVTPADLAASVTGNDELGERTKNPTNKFDHPVYKKLATINGEVNRMNKQQMKEALLANRLDTGGQKDVLKKRLKNFIRQKHLSALSKSERSAAGHVQHVNQYRYIIVIDFEATCERRAQGEPQAPYWHEIIEFPAVLVDVASRSVIDEFHSYVKPVINPVLSEFCTELTGITQEMVDAAPLFPDVLSKMEEWMKGHGLDLKMKGKKKFAILTDGPWDMSRFMYLQCKASNIAFPRWAMQWINIRKAYIAVYRLRGNAKDGRYRINLTSMLEGLGIPLVGRLHSGIADTRNIASIAVQMLHDEFSLRINEKLCASRKDLEPTGHGETRSGSSEVGESRSKFENCRLEGEGEGEKDGWGEVRTGGGCDSEGIVVVGVSRFEDDDGDDNDDDYIVFSDKNGASEVDVSASSDTNNKCDNEESTADVEHIVGGIKNLR